MADYVYVLYGVDVDPLEENCDIYGVFADEKEAQAKLKQFKERDIASYEEKFNGDYEIDVDLENRFEIVRVCGYDVYYAKYYIEKCPILKKEDKVK